MYKNAFKRIYVLLATLVFRYVVRVFVSNKL